MKNNFKITPFDTFLWLGSILVFTCILYCLFWFISWQPDPLLWNAAKSDGFGRFLFVTLWCLGSFGISYWLYNIILEHKE